MTHDEAVLLVPDLARGSLSDEVRSQAASHVSSCSECGAAMDVWKRLARSLGSEAADPASDHPPAALIAAHGLGARSLGSAQAERIEAHLRACPSCAEEVALTRESERRLGSGGATPRAVPGATASGRRWTAVAAGVAIVIAGYAMYLRLVSLPDLERERNGALAAARNAERSLREASGWSGPVSLPILGSGTRAGGEDLLVCVATGQSHVVLGFGPLPAPGAEDDAITFEIRVSAAETVWSRTLRSGEVGVLFGGSEIATFLVPADALSPRAYEGVMLLDGELVTATPFRTAPCEA